nr:hypothetical protein [Tanacetum cinerariifolium]
MSSITAQQAKLDLELVPKVKRLEIGKCNERLNPRNIQREPTFQVVLDALALTLCYSTFLITADVPEVYMHQFWDFFYKHDTFYIFKMDKKKRFILTLEIFRDIFMICPRVQGQDFDALPTNEDIVSFLRELGHTRKINSLNDAVVTTGLDKLRLSRAQILRGMYHQKNVDYVELLWEDFIYQIDNRAYKKQEKMYYPRFTKVIIHYFLTQDKTETKAYKTYLGFAIRATPPKIARKFKKASPSKRDLNLNLVPVDEEPKSAKKKVDVASGKGIELISEVALTKEAQYEEVRKKSLRDFHKSHPSSFGIVTKTALSAAKIKIFVTNEGTGVKPGVPDVIEEVSTKSEPEAWGKDKDDSNNEKDSRIEGDEDEEMDYTTSQLYDDVDIWLNKPVQADDDTVQKEGTNAELTNIQQGNENPKISQVIEDAHMTHFTLPRKTEVLVTSSSHSSDLASKFLNFLDIPHTDAEIVSPMDVHVHHEVPSKQTPTLLTVPVSVITESSPIYSTVIPQSIPSFTPPPSQSTPTPPPTTKATNPLSTLPDFINEHLDATLGASIDEFMNYLFASITARIIEQVKNQLPQILPKEVSNFAPSNELKKILIDKIDKSESYLAAPEHRECYDGLIKSYDLDKSLLSTYDKVYSLKRSQKDKDKDEDPSARSDRGLKKRKTSKDKPEFEVVDSNMPQDQEENLGNDDEEPKGKVASKREWFTKPKRPQEPTDPDWNDEKTPKQGPTQSWLMTLAYSADKQSKTFDELMSTPIDFSAYIMKELKITNLTQETLLGPLFRLLKGTRANYAELENDFEEFMNGNLQMAPVDYFFNNDLKYLQGGISTMTYTNSFTKTKAAQYDLLGIEDMVPNIKSLVKVAYDKHALWGISHWRDQRKSFYRKHGYGYLKEIVVRRADNDLCKFKEGGFPCLRINDVEDISMIIQKRVEDIQLGVESYQKKINITKPETTRPGIKKKDPYTPYQDPQGFIYVDTLGRNRLIRSDELYKFSNDTLTRLQTSLEDITKNIHMEYLPKRR